MQDMVSEYLQSTSVHDAPSAIEAAAAVERQHNRTTQLSSGDNSAGAAFVNTRACTPLRSAFSFVM